jgi:hypothetical protein
MTTVAWTTLEKGYFVHWGTGAKTSLAVLERESEQQS